MNAQNIMLGMLHQQRPCNQLGDLLFIPLKWCDRHLWCVSGMTTQTPAQDHMCVMVDVVLGLAVTLSVSERGWQSS